LVGAHALVGQPRPADTAAGRARVQALHVEALRAQAGGCGLKWSFDGQQLASGGNDNKLYVWSPHSTTPLLRFNEHTAAVKAISWSPHQNGLLASGGGTADRCIRFWNTQTASPLNCVDTGSQVCNLCLSKNINELVSTHGYSQNQIVVWRYSSMSKVATLTGHTLRVLYLAMSPDGQTIVTGAGDRRCAFGTSSPGQRPRATPPTRRACSISRGAPPSGDRATRLVHGTAV